MGWDTVYRTYALDQIPWHSDKVPASLVRSLKGVGKGLALDVCCGAGTHSIYLAKKGFKVLGVDVSKRAVEIAAERARKEGVEVDFRTGDVLNIRGTSKYDLVFDRGCFHHIANQDKPLFVRKIHRLLKPKGKYYLSAFSERNRFAKSLSKQDIHKSFSKYFDIGDIREEIHREPDQSKVFLYTTLMTKVGG